jgi:predicted ATPase/DNA-binding winged helix-turn-helix (wHTH) protein
VLRSSEDGAIDAPADAAEQGLQPIYASNGWEIDLNRRELRSQGVAVPIGGRAFEILEVLVQSAGELIGKYRLMDHVWPGAVVEENTLQFHISAIRKTLGVDRFLLKTVSGRGYRLIGHWDLREETEPGQRVGLADRKPRRQFRTNVPIAGSTLIGRDAARQHLLDVLSAYRVVTLTGPGGIGKSVLALEVARCVFPTFQGDCWLVELASLADPALVPAAVLIAIGLRIEGSEISAEAVARALGREKLLLVLDNCEHLVDDAARLVESIIRLCPNASVLATSREILRTEGEYAYRVAPLDVPPLRQGDRDVVQEYSAIQLFNARLTALGAGAETGPENLPLAAAICRRLDGIPLAIEFAAARVATLGLQQTADLLSDRFSLLTAGRRMALPRHRTLRATLDWSYELLPESERTLLRRLAICAGGFTLDAATAVMGDAGATAAMVADGIASLAAKSLVSLDASVASGRWRLLETVRAYALDKLAEDNEAKQVPCRHAAFFRDLFAPAAKGPFMDLRDLPRYAREIDNMRAALEWAFSPGAAHFDMGVGLAVAAGPVLLAMSMLPECRRWSEQALLALSAPMRGGAEEMQLQANLGFSLTYGLSDVAFAALGRSLAVADERGEIFYQMSLLAWLSLLYTRNGTLTTAMHYTRRSAAVASLIGDAATIALAHFLMGNTLRGVGDLGGACRELEAALKYRPQGQQTRTNYLGFDHGILARTSLANTLCLQGHLGEAAAHAHEAAKAAQSIDHPTALSIALRRIILVFLWIGDLPTAEELIDWYDANAQSYALAPQIVIGRGLGAELAMRRGDMQFGVEILRDCVEQLRAVGYRMMEFNISLAEGLAAIGRPAESMDLIEDGLRAVAANGNVIYMSELLRIKGNLLLAKPPADVDQAALYLRQSLEHTRQQGARLWELRTATDLAKLMAAQGRREDARLLLEPVFKWFGDGPATDDRTAAERLLTILRGVSGA